MKVKRCVACGAVFKAMSGFTTQEYCSDKCNFLSRFDVGPVDQCWEWKGRKDPKGYSFFNNWRGYRYSYEHYNGPRTEGLIIRHLCNNPGCVNPHHLKEGTYKENSADLKATGYVTEYRGEKHESSKLTNEIVLEIYNSKEDYKVLAERHNISKARVRDILHGRGWNHITGAPPFKAKRVYKKRDKETCNGTQSNNEA